MWYTAHLFFECRSSEKYLVRERLLLIEASDDDDAFEKAEQFGTKFQKNANDEETFLKCPKVTKVSHDELEEGSFPVNGSEMTFNSTEVLSEKEVTAFSNGQSVNLKVME